MYKLMLSIIFAALCSTSAEAITTSNNEVFAPEQGLDMSRSFEAQRNEIVRLLSDGETYIEIAASDRQVVMDSLGQMSSLLAGVETVEQLPEGSKIRVFNAQERINSLLTRARADSRLICRREKPTGSNRPTNTCLTVAERRRARDGAEDFLRYNPRAQAKPTER